MPCTIGGKQVIVLGDTTTHGGKVMTASSTFTYMNIPVARIGDMVECPQCKGKYPIIEGAPSAFDHENKIARHGDRVACGALLISRYNTTGISESGTVSEAVAAEILTASPPPHQQVFDEQAQLVAPPIDGVPYFIEVKDGRTFSGRVGADGLLPRVTTQEKEDITVYWGDEALAKMAGE